MKMRKNVILALAVTATVALSSTVQAIQKHDPQFQVQPVFTSSASDPDMVTHLRYQSSSPKARQDWYVINAAPSSADTRNLAREAREQNGSPHAKQDVTFMIAPLK
jgi:hypothetical protein